MICKSIPDKHWSKGTIPPGTKEIQTIAYLTLILDIFSSRLNDGWGRHVFTPRLGLPLGQLGADHLEKLCQEVVSSQVSRIATAKICMQYID